LNGENSITINCLVTNKKFIQKSEEHNPVHDEYILSLQVLDISKKECGFTLKEPIDIGDELEIELFSYARVATGR
jgi:helix-turn-helix protein